MELQKTEGVRIAGICACVPRNAVRNETKVAEATGIVTRRIAAEGTTVVDLCVKAAERALFAGFGGGLSVSLGLIDLDDGCKLSVLEL